MAQDQAAALKRDILLCLFFILVGLIALVSINTSGSHGNVAGTQTLSFSTLPNAYAALLLLFSIVILAGSALKLRKATRPDEPRAAQDPDDHKPVAGRRTILLRTWGTLLLLVAYALLLEWVHFILLTTLFLASLFLLFGRRSPLKVAGIAILGGIGFHLLFIVGLNLPI